MFGARIIVLLKSLSEIALLPMHPAARDGRLGENSEFEIKYGLAMIRYLTEVALGFYNNTLGLEGSTNPNAVLLVEFWWWLHRKADYLVRGHLEARSWCKELSQDLGLVSFAQDLVRRRLLERTYAL